MFRLRSQSRGWKRQLSLALTVASLLPAHVYAPYFETWTHDSIARTAKRTGVRYFTLAFLETLGKRSCTLAWNGNPKRKLARYRGDVASLRKLGGDVIVSFGGWSADERGTDVADSCSDVNKLAAAYENVIATYDVTRVDLDVEGNSLLRPSGIDRRNKALKLVENWAAAQGLKLQISYTLPVMPYGLAPDVFGVLQNAVTNGTRVDVVNVMPFDFYDGFTTNMGGAAVSAAFSLFFQLRSLYPDKGNGDLWAMEGITMDPGVDDFRPPIEVTSTIDAQLVYDFATAAKINTLSIWSIQRDRFGFSRILAPFTRP